MDLSVINLSLGKFFHEPITAQIAYAIMDDGSKWTNQNGAHIFKELKHKGIFPFNVGTKSEAKKFGANLKN
jgi:hypothetical protein